MKLQFWGAAKTVTGSMHLVETNGHRILLDCGMFQGRRQEARERNAQLPFDVTGIDAVVLSHAHIDHSGNLPTLVKSGFDKSIYSTSATRDLCSAMLRDSATIQESDAEFVNKRNVEKGLPLVKPRQVFVVHGEPDAAQAMTDGLRGLGIQNVTIPERGKTFEV